MNRTGGVLAALLAIVLVGCGKAEESAPLGFAPHPGAVQAPWAHGDWVPENVGLRDLVPVGDCVVGVGTYANGYRNVSANWLPDAGCARLDIRPAPDGSAGGGDFAGERGRGWPGGGLAATSVVAGPADSVIGVYESGQFARLDRTGEVVRLAKPGNVQRVTGLARAGGTLVAVGTAEEPASSPIAWVSTDDGATVAGVPLPRDPASTHATDLPWSVTAAGSTVVAVTFGSPLSIWSSTDAGRTWTVEHLDDLPKSTNVEGVLPVGDRWLLYGSAEAERGPNRPVLISGTPGDWRLDDTAALGEGGIVAATVDARGLPVLLGRTYLPHVPEQNQTYCSTVWTRTTTDWARGSLGCAQQPATAITTLRDGRVVIAGNRDLWIRPASA
ncbi:hypothetical protein [Actinokineospora spheciospongiae]|uniref:hypothetical protein n=1 Tax=Actinokineospora spheciospongiae TaxID=909613 RepID=UPI0011B3C223|nr:hypothetical protein [Actinokineospora spheciospongiae]